MAYAGVAMVFGFVCAAVAAASGAGLLVSLAACIVGTNLFLGGIIAIWLARLRQGDTGIPRPPKLSPGAIGRGYHYG